MGNIFKGSLMIIKAVRGPLQGLIRENNAKGVRREMEGQETEESFYKESFYKEAGRAGEPRGVRRKG